MLVDTHCHIHEATYPLIKGEVLQHAQEANVAKMICVGTSEASSREAIAFAEAQQNVFASIGVHPHDTKDGYSQLSTMASPKIVAVGEIGLDYFYTHSPRDVQLVALRAQIDLAIERDLPIIFHVREAFDDFWPIFDSYNGKIRGVLHSFTDTHENMAAAVARGLYIGVNGISTFTKDTIQQEMFAAIPLANLLVETDAPFLTPTPLRGKVNEPAFVKQVAEHHARIRGLSFDEVATRTSANAHALFAL